MTKASFLAAALLTAATLAPSLADARHYRHHRYHWPLPYQISYLHNYGPGLQPGTFAYYDGPSTNHCARARPPISARTAAGIPASDVRCWPCSGQV